MTERTSIDWIHLRVPQVATMARAGPGQSQEPEASSRSSMWVAGVQVIGLSSIAFLRSLAGT